MDTEIISLLIKYPSVFIGKFIAEPLVGSMLAYGIVWQVMRPKGGKRINNYFLWHSCGITATVFGSAIFRIMAITTFAGRSAYEPMAEDGGLAFYTLFIPAIVAVGYITWMKRKVIPKLSI